jgi:hypothetical protein
MRNPNLQMDERSAAIFRKVCTFLYLATVGVLWGDVLYRRIRLGQSVADFLDIAVLLTANVIVAIAAILYFGGITLPKIRASYILLFYAVAVAAGTGFWLLQDPASAGIKLLSVASIAAVLILLYLLAAYRYTRAIDRKLED